MEKIKFKELFGVLKQTASTWWDKDPFRQSATIAYYAIFSLPALLLIAISVAGFAFGQDAVNGKVAGFIGSSMGKETALQVQDMVAKSALGNKSWYALTIGLITMFVGAIGVFTELQKSLNYIWEVKPKPTKKFLKTLKDRLFSFGLVISIGFLLMISLVITSILAALGDWMTVHFSEGSKILIHILNFVFSFGSITSLFALMFKILPDAEIRWRYVWSGAFLTTFLFILGKYALSFYFGKFQPASAYGAAGSIVLVLLWVSYSSMIVFFGAEFTRQLTEKKDGKITPSADAEKTLVNPDKPEVEKKEKKIPKSIYLN